MSTPWLRPVSDGRLKSSMARVRESVARSSNGATFFFSLGIALLYRFVTEMMHDERPCLGGLLAFNQVQAQHWVSFERDNFRRKMQKKESPK